MKILKYQAGTPNGGILNWQQVMLNVDENHVPHFLQPRYPNLAQFNSISQGEINRLKRDKQQREAELRRAEQLSKSQHMWNWTGPLMNTSSTNKYNALSRYNFNKEAMKGAATVGLTAALAPALAPGGAFWTKGILWLNPSHYLGRGAYSTVLGGLNASAFGALADNALVSYGGAEALQHFRKNPNFQNGTSAVLAGMPLLVKPTLTTNQFIHSFNLGRYKTYEDLYNRYNISLSNAIKLFDLANSVKRKLGKFNTDNLKGKDRVLFDAILKNTENNLFGKKGANDAINKALLSPDEEKLLTILEKYNPILEKAFNRIKNKYGSGIDWNWEESYFNGMPLEFKIKPLYDPNVNGVSDTRPFILRFYENVSKITEEGGLMDDVLKSGELRPKGNRWEGLNELTGKYEEVDPTLYIVSKLKNYKESGNRLTTAAEKIPYHGTMGTSTGQSPNWSELSRKYANGAMTDDDNAIFTVIKDDMPGVGSMLGKYKLGKRGEIGVSIPFFRKLPRFEHKTYPVMNASDPEIVRRVGNRHMSNDYGIWGELKSYFRGQNGGTAQEVKAVSDPQSTGQRVNEYNFGAGTPDVKSIWNTLDFEPMRIIRDENGKIIKIIRTSPFAYNKSTNTNNNYLA